MENRRIMKFGYTIIYVQNVRETLYFYEKAFGCAIRFLHPDNIYGELETGDTTLGFACEKYTFDIGVPTALNRLKQGKLPSGVEIAFVTQDVQKAFEKAVEAGASPYKYPEKMYWGQTISYVQDLNGTLVQICTKHPS